MQTVGVFDRKKMTAAQIAEQRLRRALARPMTERMHYLTELIAVAGTFSFTPSNKPSMQSLQAELLHFLRQLQQYEVAYLLIGGFAVNIYGFARYTGDLDLWIHDTPDNRLRLGAAAAGAGVPGGDQLAHMDWVPGWTGFQLSNGFEVEVTGYIAAFEVADFPACLARAEFFTISDVRIPVLNIEDLILEKQTSARPKDAEDVAQLLMVLRLRG